MALELLISLGNAVFLHKAMKRTLKTETAAAKRGTSSTTKFNYS